MNITQICLLSFQVTLDGLIVIQDRPTKRRFSQITQTLRTLTFTVNKFDFYCTI